MLLPEAGDDPAPTGGLLENTSLTHPLAVGGRDVMACAACPTSRVAIAVHRVL